MSSTGKEILRRLKNFTDALAVTEDISKRFTCRTVRLDLQPKQYKGHDVKKVRQLLGASQPIFAQFLGVSKGAVRDWEQNLKPPTGAACRMMDEISKNPSYFVKRLKELSTVKSKAS
ncbi:MAG: transcriptional regulator [Planctomycetota bacterium]|nr:transcriptional regulator [Planctomycetota bacterium]